MYVCIKVFRKVIKDKSELCPFLCQCTCFQNYLSIVRASSTFLDSITDLTYRIITEAMLTFPEQVVKEAQLKSLHLKVRQLAYPILAHTSHTTEVGQNLPFLKAHLLKQILVNEGVLLFSKSIKHCLIRLGRLISID